MSSYFDAAQSKLTQLFDANRPFPEHLAVLTAALDRYEAYLRWVDSQLRAPDRAQLPQFQTKLAAIREGWSGLEGLAHRNEYDAIMWCGEHLQDLHELAHRLGSARLMKRNRTPVLDNPYWDGHVDRME